MAKAIRKAPPARRNRRGTDDGDIETGRRIRLCRIDRGMSQTTLAEKLDVSFQQVQKYEKGKNRISSQRLNQIAEILGVTPHDLMGWKSTATTVAMDPETYNLARAFLTLPDKLKPIFRVLIENIVKATANA